MKANENLLLIDKFLLNDLSDNEIDSFIQNIRQEDFLSEIVLMQTLKRTIVQKNRKDLKSKLDDFHQEHHKDEGVVIQMSSVIKYGIAACLALGICVSSYFLSNNTDGTYSSHTGGAGIIQKYYSALIK